MSAVRDVIHDADPYATWEWFHGEHVLAGSSAALTPGRTVEVHGDDGTVVEREVGDFIGTFSDGRVARLPADSDPVRWHQHHGVWVLRGRGLVEGIIVMVRSARNGTTAEQVGPVVCRDADGYTLAMPSTCVQRPSGCD